LTTNSSREFVELSDFPSPQLRTPFPKHDELTRYYNAYAKHFSVLSCVAFKHEVKSVKEKGHDGRWTVCVEHNGVASVVEFDGVVVCSGQFAEKR
jgi:cation diffusion facilitator CzcD-associated flavoprotein CzcO